MNAIREKYPAFGVRRRTTPAVAVLAVVFLASIAWTWWRTGGDIIASRDDGAQPIYLPGMIMVAVVTLALARLLPPGRSTSVPRPTDRVHARQEIVVLLLCSLVFPFTALIPGPQEDYVLWKVALLILVPAAYLGWRARRKGSSIKTGASGHGHGHSASRWVLFPAVVYVVLTQFGPLAPGSPTGWPNPTTLIIATLITALTAGLGEELFYRYWLQSRLEALAGRWIGILLTSIAYGLMHVGSHGAGLGWDLSITTVIASQGVFGVVLGYLWSKYRNFWVCVFVHVANNGTLVVLHLLGLA